MNYLKHYINLCKKAKNRTLEGYTERHHIFPSSIFGKNNKIIKLTAKEHFIAHFLLWKIMKCRYGLDHWKTHKMGYAFYKMTISSTNQTRYRSRSYEIIKKWYSENNPSKYRNLSGKNNPMFGRTQERHPLFGIPCSEERKLKIGAANKGKLSGENNPSKRDEVRKKISESWIGREPVSRDKNKRSKITETQVKEILLLWEKEREAGLSGYKFCKKYNEKYNVKPATLGNIIYKPTSF